MFLWLRSGEGPKFLCTSNERSKSRKHPTLCSGEKPPALTFQKPFMPRIIKINVTDNRLLTGKWRSTDLLFELVNDVSDNWTHYSDCLNDSVLVVGEATG